MSTLSSVGGISSMISAVTGTNSTKRLDPSEVLDQVFSNLDTEGKGYLEASDFQTAFDSLNTDTSDEDLTGVTAQDVFSALDSDGDGKVTTDDMTQSLQTMTDSLGYLQGMMGMPPPPPGGGQAGFSEDELTDQLDALTESGDTDSYGTQLLTNILDQFDTADADGDGLVSGTEAASFAQSLEDASSDSTTAANDSTGTTTTASSASTASTASSETKTSTTSDLLVMQRIMQLMETYGSSYQSSETSDQLSLIA